MLTTIKLKLKTKRFTKSSRKRFEKLKDARTAEVFQAKVDGKFAALCILDGDIGTLANRLKEGLLATAGGVLWRQRTKIQSRVPKEVLDLCDQR